MYFEKNFINPSKWRKVKTNRIIENENVFR